MNDTTAFMFALLAFAAGFFVRPFGALVFGRLGDLVGRKYTFLITIVIMGARRRWSACLPSYETIGVAAPIILICLRLLQGLALGGEYGGAATYVAEHAPDGKRGLYTSWIQTTATLGLFLSLLVILACRIADVRRNLRRMGLAHSVPAVHRAAGRLGLHPPAAAESPVFQEIKAEGKLSKAPLTEAFGQWSNLKIVLLALLGATAGQAVVWYGGQFYALFFLEKMLQVDSTAANIIMAAALLIATPFFVVFGALSDKIGRKKIVLAGCLLAALTYFPIFHGLTHFANPALDAAVKTSPVDGRRGSERLQLPVRSRSARKPSPSPATSRRPRWRTSGMSVRERSRATRQRSLRAHRYGRWRHAHRFDSMARPMSPEAFKASDRRLRCASSRRHWKPPGIRPRPTWPSSTTPMVILLCTLLVLYVTMVYGPIAAWLVELFPARIRYTSMSLPYHIGNGWFGGFLPVTSFAIVAATGNIYNGLWYPIVVAGHHHRDRRPVPAGDQGFPGLYG